jgi:dihydroorotate dehydrogenase electron transfer subunit
MTGTGPASRTNSAATTASTRGQFDAIVVANVPLCREHYRLVLRVALAFPPTEPGQFMQVACRDLSRDYSPEHEQHWAPGATFDVAGRELMSPLAFLRRPFSLAGRRDVVGGGGATELDLIHRVVGVGTDWMSKLAPGDVVGVLGPLGNRFALPPADGLALLVGGGVGIPPMLYLAERLAGRRGVAFCGALTRDLLPLTITATAPAPTTESTDPVFNIAEFAGHGIPSVITTDDGSFGYRGYVTQALEAWLDRELSDPAARARAVIYTCGPEPMMKRVGDIATRRGIACQIAVERAMACGMGTCQSCCIKVRKPDPSRPPLAGKDWCWRLACTDGPVFEAKDLLW